jgi:hypothetical protein
VFPVGRDDPAAFPLAVLLVDLVERQLLPVNVQAAYDRHRDLLKLRDHRCPTQKFAASELRRPPTPPVVKTTNGVHLDQPTGPHRPMHVI